MRKKRIFKALNLTLTLFLLILSYFLVSAGVEHIKFNDRIEEFKSKSEFVEERVVYGYSTKFYEVKREEWMYQKPFYNLGDEYVGTDGDILLTRVSPLGIPLVDDIVFNFFGGHSAIITDAGLKQIEAQGDDPAGANHVKKIRNDWYSYSGETVGVRVKGVTEEVIKNVISLGEELVEKKVPYNYTFVLNTKKSFYCTDLISYLYQQQNYRINDDRIASTTYDLAISKNTYITYFSYVDKSMTRHFYYLG